MRARILVAVVIAAAGVTVGATMSWADGGAAPAVAGVVFGDTNGDGVRGAGETGVAGIAVQLKDLKGGTYADAKTDAEGRYSFAPPVPTADYKVKVYGTDKLTLTRPDVGGDPTVDSDIDWVTGLSPIRHCTETACDGESDAGLTERRADIAIAADPTSVNFPAQGGSAVTKIVYTNPGTVPKIGDSLSVEIPDGVTLTPKPAPDWKCHIDDFPALICNTESVLVPGAVSMPVEVTVTANKALTAELEFRMNGFYRDPTENPADNFAKLAITATR
ncbi:SdrD B-like protein [Herbihabitans rhizosphaerae]|uniref:SdrD B-like protein n=1 Tax=Herbihabitans rhizosphaerae TaxID=1872711 RepID=A0A4Q7KHU8_9PSEU|nr:SdrD B-like domain-containing protein [Herbihabitans rhizosphaerae]RZS34873.1 SdrD B-like protein [Herbihabitans rhizosphaerae]